MTGTWPRKGGNYTPAVSAPEKADSGSKSTKTGWAPGLGKFDPIGRFK